MGAMAAAGIQNDTLTKFDVKKPPNTRRGAADIAVASDLTSDWLQREE